jgi:hypothetical protein
MVETTLLVVAGRALNVPRLIKRLLEIVSAVALTAAATLIVIVGNGLLLGRQASLHAGVVAWLGFVRRPDILATMTLTAAVSVFLLHWHRKQERRVGGSGRAGG